MITRIKGALLQELFIMTHSMEVFVDAVVFPLVNVVIFGFISLYLAGANEATAGQYVLVGMVLWQAVYITTYSVGVGAMWNIWSRNLSNMFVAPLRVKEYVAALFASGCIKALALVALGMFLSATLFNFNMLEIGLGNLAFSFAVLALFGFSLAIMSLGFIFRYGTRLAALSWSVSFLFQPLAAAFYPLNALPRAMQVIAYLLPPTYAFEATRKALQMHATDWALFGTGLGIDAIWCLLAIFLFRYLFARSLDTGQFARNES